VTFVCSVCRQVIRDPLKRYVERQEFRRLDGKDRPHVRQVRDICKSCMETYWMEQTEGAGVQGRLA
jgi:hypothetical protein